MSAVAAEWKKILYVKQPNFPDNYVDRNLFLGELRKNVTVKLYSYDYLVKASLVISQQVASVVIFVAFFCYIYNDWWLGVRELLFLANSISFLFYLTWLAYVRRERDEERRAAGKQSGKSGVLFMMTLLGLTPVLWTLTQDVSSDSIWTLTTICLLVNLCFVDYDTAPVATMSDSLSLNAAIFASVMLASRLPSKAHVFSLLSIAVAWFALFPLLRRSLIRGGYIRLQVPLTLALVAIASIMLASLIPWLALVFMTVILMITFVLPAVYVYLQRYKNEIHGPWDEASVRLNVKNK